jgi:hypothetical protein
MNPLAELDQLNLEPAAKNHVAALLQALLDQAAQDAKTIEAKDLKIGALTYELAYYKRIRFSAQSEALTAQQRDVFEETFDTRHCRYRSRGRAASRPLGVYACDTAKTSARRTPALTGSFTPH